MSNLLGILPLLCFVLLFLTFERRPRFKGADQHDWRDSWLAASICWGVAIAVFTEALGLAHLISRGALLVTWSAFAIVLALGEGDGGAARRGTSLTFGRWRKDGTLRDPLVTGLLVVFALLAMLAILAPPNNWDSMVYHMGRVVHWMQNRSVDHYPTSIDRQLYLGPWTEFAILHFQVLTGGDRWANLVQWMAMPGCAIAASLIARQLGAASPAQLTAAVVVAATPVAILESTSTQTDLTVAFWLACFVYYARALHDSTSDAHDRSTGDVHSSLARACHPDKSDDLPVRVAVWCLAACLGLEGG